MEKNKVSWIQVVLILIIVGSTVLLAIKGLVTTEISMADEAHYIATAHRFYQGDAMLVDDWSSEQLNGFLLLPFVYLYMLLFGSTEGIILGFRIIYLVFKFVIAAWAIYRLRGKYGKWAWLGTALFYSFTPYNIDTLSYNTIPIAMMFMIGILMLSESEKKLDYFMCGIFLAIAVLAQPFLGLLYLIGVLSSIIYTWNKNNNKDVKVPILHLKNYALLTLGAGLLAIIFCLFIFSRAGLEDIISNVIHVFEEPDHNMAEHGLVMEMFKKVKTVIHVLIIDYKSITIINVIMIAVICIFKKNKEVLFTGAVLCLVLSLGVVLLEQSSFVENTYFIPFFWFAIEELMLYQEGKVKYLTVFGMAFLYAVCVAMGTNTGILSTSAALCVLAVFSIICMCDFQIKKDKLVFLSMVGVVVLAFCLRIVMAWTDVITKEHFSHYIDKGPLKGTFTFEECYHSYQEMIEVLEMIEYDENDILFSGTPTPLAYLYANVEYGTMGTPFFFLDYDRLNTYYLMHPEKYPTIVYYQELTEEDKQSSFYMDIEKKYDILTGDEKLLAVRRNGE